MGQKQPAVLVARDGKKQDLLPGERFHTALLIEHERHVTAITGKLLEQESGISIAHGSFCTCVTR
jgi:methylglyoxal synthase